MTDDTSTPLPKATWIEGVRAISPILLGVVPFGMIFGVTAVAADVPLLAAWASSFIVFAGAAQIAIVEVMDSGGAPAVAIVTAAIINARHLMYSADVGRFTADAPLAVKAGVAYGLTDQAYLVTAYRFPSPEASSGYLAFYTGAAATLWISWQISTSAGIILGSAVPSSWSLEFAIPLTFVALLVFALKDRPGYVAAGVGAAVAVVTMHLPYNLGLPLGALAGIAAGMVAEERGL